MKCGNSHWGFSLHPAIPFRLWDGMGDGSTQKTAGMADGSTQKTAGMADGS
jgi:hypothetical protein